MAIKKNKRKKQKNKKRRSKKTHAKKPQKFSVLQNKKLNIAIIILLSASLLLSILYIVYLDIKIRSQFEGKRWALPARVYARPLEVYVGKHLSHNSLINELEFLNYRFGSDAPGTYKREGTTIILSTRGFTFWDTAEPARKLAIATDGKVVTEILDINSGKTLQLVRIEPVQIASIYPQQKEDRDLIQLDQVPPVLIQALLAVEDKDFYQHNGVKPTAILRAMVANLQAGAAVQGGSTLTQQLVKNFFLSNERTLRRKLVEAIMALLLEWHYDKDEILEAYLNEVYLGQQRDNAIHGLALASRFYFDRPLETLDTAEIALLVGLIKGPSYYNPWRHPERALQRRNLVIEILQAQKVLSDEDARLARLSPLKLRSQQKIAGSSYPAFLDLLKRQLQDDYQEKDLRSEGLRIFTTLDPLVQNAAEKALAKFLSRLESSRNMEPGVLQGAIVVTASDTGEVLALVGDRDPHFQGFNRALDAKRPIGSLVKPAVYLSALQNVGVYTPVTLIEDAALTFTTQDGQIWQPTNFDEELHGEIPLFHGLVYSYNLATAHLGLKITVEQVIDTLKSMGLKQNPPPYPSLLLGSLDLSPWEVSELYQTLSGGGFTIPLRGLREVLTANGSRLNRYSLEIKQTLDPPLVYMINSLLQQVARIGTAKSIGQRLPALQAAGKTGTSDDLRDSWFAGFTGRHLAVVWVGRDDNQPMGLSGAAAALPIWIDLMSNIQTKPLEMAVPDQIEPVWVNLASGLRSKAKCEDVVQLPFIRGTEPKRRAACGKKRSLFRWFSD